MDAELARKLAERTVAADGGCELWLGGCDASGYPRIAVGRKMRGVRRIVVELALGSALGPGIAVFTSCENRKCVARAHLRVGSRPLRERCGRGHADWAIRRDGRRTCRVCDAATSRQYQARRRATESAERMAAPPTLDFDVPSFLAVVPLEGRPKFFTIAAASELDRLVEDVSARGGELRRVVVDCANLAFPGD